MILVGLTGSIGMGKSATAQMFAEAGVPVYDADAAVHALYQSGGAAVEPIGRLFPEAIKDGGVDRAALGACVLGDPEKLKALESIVHPLVREAQAAFLRRHAQEGAPIVVLDIPLLFETGGDQWMTATVVVSAPLDIQRARVLARPGMTEEKFQQILAKQTPDSEKRARATFVIETDRGFDYARAQVHAVLDVLRKPPYAPSHA